MRVLLVSRTFWPTAGPIERTLGHLADQLTGQGVACTVLTVRRRKTWPDQFVHRVTPVTRVTASNQSLWGRMRYVSTLARWMRERRDLFDAACVSGLGREAYAALQGLPPRMVAIRCEMSGPHGDLQTQLASRSGRRISSICQQAGAIIAASETCRRELLAADYASEQVHVIANGAPPQSPRTAPSQQTAREVLADTHEIFALPRDARLAVYSGPFYLDQGLLDLVDAWAEVVRARPKARLWLIGDGPDGYTIWRRIQRLELEQHIIMPGDFDDLGELLRAADLLIAPAHEEHTITPLVEAAAAGLPILASDLPGFRAALAGAAALFLPPRAPAALAAQIIAALDSPPPPSETYCAPSLLQMAREHRLLFERMLGR